MDYTNFEIRPTPPALGMPATNEAFMLLEGMARCPRCGARINNQIEQPGELFANCILCRQDILR